MQKEFLEDMTIQEFKEHLINNDMNPFLMDLFNKCIDIEIYHKFKNHPERDKIIAYANFEIIKSILNEKLMNLKENSIKNIYNINNAIIQ